MKDSTPIRVLFLIKDMDRIGGAQKHLLTLQESLRNDIDPYIACIARKNSKLINRLDGVKMFTGMGPESYSIGNVVNSIILLKKIVNQHDIQIIYAYGFEASFIGSLAAYFSRVPFISRRGELAAWRKKKHMLAFGLINMIASVIVVNSPQVQFITEKELFSKDKIRLIRNAIKTRSIPKSDIKKNTKIIGMIANLRRIKNHLQLLASVPEITRRFPNLEVWLIGEGPDRDYIKELIIELKIEKNVQLLGYRDDIESLLPKMDCCVLTSHAEGSPHAILEAMSFGVPVVATSVGGNNDAVVDGHTGFLVKPGDVKELAKKISVIFQDNELAKEMAEASQERVQNLFSMANMVTEHQKLFVEIVRPD
jgi:glycosyltransferase involved in cell wall biosynthesis